MLVVGDGAEAAGRVLRLQEAGADVTHLGTAAYQVQALDGCWLVIAATDDAALDAEIFGACTERRIFCNCVDRPECCSFFLMSEERLGEVCLAIGTAGTAPGLTGRLRREARAGLPEDIGELVRAYAELRRTLPPPQAAGLTKRRAALRWLASRPWPFFRQPLADQQQQWATHMADLG